MVLAVIRQAAEAATGPNGPFYGYPPWLVVLVGALAAALLLWIFSKLLKIAVWILIVLVLVVGAVTAAKMLMGS